MYSTIAATTLAVAASAGNTGYGHQDSYGRHGHGHGYAVDRSVTSPATDFEFKGETEDKARDFENHNDFDGNGDFENKARDFENHHEINQRLDFEDRAQDIKSNDHEVDIGYGKDAHGRQSGFDASALNRRGSFNDGRDSLRSDRFVSNVSRFGDRFDTRSGNASQVQRGQVIGGTFNTRSANNRSNFAGNFGFVGGDAGAANGSQVESEGLIGGSYDTRNGFNGSNFAQQDGFFQVDGINGANNGSQVEDEQVISGFNTDIAANRSNFARDDRFFGLGAGPNASQVQRSQVIGGFNTNISANRIDNRFDNGFNGFNGSQVIGGGRTLSGNFEVGSATINGNGFDEGNFNVAGNGRQVIGGGRTFGGNTGFGVGRVGTSGR